jgi:hypothetical protein
MFALELAHARIRDLHRQAAEHRRSHTAIRGQARRLGRSR